MKRSQIAKKILANSEKIKAIRQENIELNRQQLLLSDKNQWYTESEEMVGRGKNKKTVLVGLVNWKEYFRDEDNPKNNVCIERKQVVRENGEWLNGY